MAWAPTTVAGSGVELLEDRYRSSRLIYLGMAIHPGEVGSGRWQSPSTMWPRRWASSKPVVIGHSLGASTALVYVAAFDTRLVVAGNPVALHVLELSKELALWPTDFGATIGKRP